MPKRPTSSFLLRKATTTGPCESRQIYWGHQRTAQFFTANSSKEMFDLENFDKCHGVQHSQWSYSMANINLCRPWTFFASSQFFQIFTFHWFQMSWPWKCRSVSWCTTFVVPSFEGKYLISYLMTIVMFVFSTDTCQNNKLKSLTLKI